MNIKDWEQTKQYLARPSRKVLEAKAKKELGIPGNIEITGQRLLNWINYNNKVFGNNKMPLTEDELKIAEDVEKSLKKSSIDERTDSNQVKRDTKVAPKKEKWTYQSWADGLEERTRPVKKTPEAKKILVVTKTKPVKPLQPLDPLLDYDWRLAPWYDYPEDDDVKPEEDKTRIREKIKTGITKLI